MNIFRGAISIPYGSFIPGGLEKGHPPPLLGLSLCRVVCCWLFGALSSCSRLRSSIYNKNSLPRIIKILLSWPRWSSVFFTNIKKNNKDFDYTFLSIVSNHYNVWAFRLRTLRWASEVNSISLSVSFRGRRNRMRRLLRFDSFLG